MRKMLDRALIMAVLACSMLATCQLTMAQGVANLSGVIKDPNGAVVAGVGVNARNVATGQTRDAESDVQGRYTFPNLTIGRYEVIASHAGFKKTMTTVDLTVGQEAELNFALEPGGVSETVIVEAQPQQLAIDTETSTYGQLVSRRQVENREVHREHIVDGVAHAPLTAHPRPLIKHGGLARRDAVDGQPVTNGLAKQFLIAGHGILPRPTGGPVGA